MIQRRVFLPGGGSVLGADKCRIISQWSQQLDSNIFFVIFSANKQNGSKDRCKALKVLHTYSVDGAVLHFLSEVMLKITCGFGSVSNHEREEE